MLMGWREEPDDLCGDAVLSDAVDGVVDGAFAVAGQNCLSVQRVYVHSSVYTEFLSRTVAQTRQLKLGSKHRRDTDIVRSSARPRHSGSRSGSRRRSPTGRWSTRAGPARRLLEPTVLTDVTEGSHVLTDEVFGPVVTIIPFEDLADAIAAANSSDSRSRPGSSPSRSRLRSPCRLSW